MKTLTEVVQLRLAIWPLLTLPLLLILAAIGLAIGLRLSVIFCLAYAAIAIVPFVLRSRGPALIDPFEPYFGLSVLLFLYGLSTIQFTEQYQLTIHGEGLSPKALSEYVLACLLGQVGLLCGHLAGRRGFWKGPSSTPSNGGDGYIRFLLGPALLIAVLMFPFYFSKFNFFDVVSYADAALEWRIVHMQDTTSGVRDLFLRDAPAILLLCACVVVMFDSHRPMWKRAVAIVLICSYLTVNLLSGWRGQLAIGALIPVMLFHYKVRNLRWPVIAIGGLIVYVLINAMSVMRSSSVFLDMLGVLYNEVSDNGFAFLGLSKSGELATSSNLLRLITGIQDGETEFRWGGQFLSQFAIFIPRVLWPSRPLAGSELFTQIFYPGVLEAGGGYGFFVLQEGYWDFGLLGVILYSAIMGWFTRWIYVKLIIERTGQIWILLYSVVYSQLVLSVVRSGFFGSIKGALMMSLPLLIVVWFGSPSRRPPQTTTL